MKNGKVLILLLTVVFLLLTAGIGYMEPAPQPDTEVNIPLSVMAVLDGQRERILCWEDRTGDWIVFIPSGLELTDVTISLEKQTQVLLDGQLLENGMDCSGFQADVPYPVICVVDGVSTENILTFLQSDRLPSLYVDVQSGNMDIIHETKGNQESGHLRLYDQKGKLIHSGQMECLSGRGNSSWLEDKKPYSLTLSREADLLGMGAAKRWVLLANAMDPSHLRNKVAYDLAAKAGAAYTPESQWVNLYLNGEYTGIYLLSERNEIHPQRVDLSENGSFLVSRESRWRLISQNYPRVITDSGAALRIHSSGLTERDLHRIWQPVENAILSENGIDPMSGRAWQELIDLDSWVMEYLAGEIFGNVDTGTISAYFYRDGRDPLGKIYAGPVWDYDLSMGSEGTWQTEMVQVFFGDKAHIWSLEDASWFYGLNRKPEFQNRVRELYRNVYRPLLQELLETGLDTYLDQLGKSTRLDQCRWGTSSAEEETENIRRYLTERMAFLDSVWLENVQYCKALVILDENSSSICHGILPGERIPFLPDYEENGNILGWYDAATEQPFDITQPIYEDTVVYLKRLPGGEEQISRLQAVPIATGLGILIYLILADRNHRQPRKAKREKQIAKQKIV